MRNKVCQYLSMLWEALKERKYRMNTNKPSCLRSEDSERRDDRLHMVYWAYEMCCSGESINRPRLYDEFYQGVFSMIQLIC